MAAAYIIIKLIKIFLSILNLFTFTICYQVSNATLFSKAVKNELSIKMTQLIF